MIQAQIDITSWRWPRFGNGEYQIITLGDLPMDCILHYPYGYDEGTDHNYVHVFKIFVDDTEIIPWVKSLPDYGQEMHYVISFDHMTAADADMYIEIYNDYRE